MTRQFDRSAEDVGNIITLEHVNTLIPDQSQAHLFYISGMGFTRDPYVDFGMRNMWVNLGRQQFHLPVGEPQVVRGVVGLVVPSLQTLEKRLEAVSEKLAETQLAWQRVNGRLDVTSPWGNRLEVHERGAFGRMALGMPYVQFEVPLGTTPGIARFYERVLAAPAEHVSGNNGELARVRIGFEQTLEFRETDAPQPDFDGHHIAIYLADFSGPHEWLDERGLIAEESNQAQYRFNHIVDPDSGERLFEVEHEVRSLSHPMYGRPLVNRNPEQSLSNYVRDNDAFSG
ncbi:MAG: hypothetical protein AAF458_07190 [Pseudomonadota bacterium]